MTRKIVPKFTVIKIRRQIIYGDKFLYFDKYQIIFDFFKI